MARETFEFGRERRIRKRPDFLRVQSHGERATTPHFVLLVDARDGGARQERLGPSRLGVVATKKVGDATARNRIKRVCRECFRLWPDFVPPGIDLVVIAREGADGLPLAQVREEWRKARAQLLRRCESVLLRAREKQAKEAVP
jgi:ribonuclease P protein component